MVTSESSDVNVSISFNITTADGSARNLVGFMRPSAVPLIATLAVLFSLTLFNLVGNSFTLITIRMTPRLWTKTNIILASHLVSHFLTGIVLICVNCYLLHIILFDNPCRWNVVTTIVTVPLSMTAKTSVLHTILVSVERFIAIVYPLHYETMFTDRTLKWAISAVWGTAIFMSVTYALWLINADLSECSIVPLKYQLITVTLYIIACTCLFICYGKILAVSWHHRVRIEPLPGNARPNPVAGSAPGAATVTTTTHSGKATSSGNTVDQNNKPLTGWPATMPTQPAATSDLTQEQQKQKIKSRRREFKAAYLTAAVVGGYVIMGFPINLGIMIEIIGLNPVVVNYTKTVGGAMGTFYMAATWAIYAAVSKSYRHAYRQMLIRIGCCCCKNITPPTDHSLVI